MKKILKKYLPGPVSTILSNKMGLTGIIIIIVLVSRSVLAPFIAPHSYNRRSGSPHESPGLEHPLGTTKMGKDVFSRLLY